MNRPKTAGIFKILKILFRNSFEDIIYNDVLTRTVFWMFFRTFGIAGTRDLSMCKSRAKNLECSAMQAKNPLNIVCLIIPYGRSSKRSIQISNLPSKFEPCQKNPIVLVKIISGAIVGFICITQKFNQLHQKISSVASYQ